MMADPSQARLEREAICDLLTELGPDQPTLCAGWRTRDLAAHLVLRERRPAAALGIAVRPLAKHTARVQRALAQRPFAELVDTLRRPPRWSPLSLPPLDQAANTLEMFIHHEDIRRGQPQWRPRQLAPALTEALWPRVRAMARLRLRRFPALVVIDAPGHGLLRAGLLRAGPDGGNAQDGGNGGQVRLTGDPGELTLFLSGRQAAAQVELAGPADLTGRLRAARLGL